MHSSQRVLEIFIGRHIYEAESRSRTVSGDSFLTHHILLSESSRDATRDLHPGTSGELTVVTVTRNTLHLHPSPSSPISLHSVHTIRQLLVLQRFLSRGAAMSWLDLPLRREAESAFALQRTGKGVTTSVSPLRSDERSIRSEQLLERGGIEV
jgi:hypothetical protein